MAISIEQGKTFGNLLLLAFTKKGNLQTDALKRFYELYSKLSKIDQTALFNNVTRNNMIEIEHYHIIAKAFKKTIDAILQNALNVFDKEATKRYYLMQILSANPNKAALPLYRKFVKAATEMMDASSISAALEPFDAIKGLLTNYRIEDLAKKHIRFYTQSISKFIRLTFLSYAPRQDEIAIVKKIMQETNISFLSICQKLVEDPIINQSSIRRISNYKDYDSLAEAFGLSLEEVSNALATIIVEDKKIDLLQFVMYYVKNDNKLENKTFFTKLLSSNDVVHRIAENHQECIEVLVETLPAFKKKFEAEMIKISKEEQKIRAQILDRGAAFYNLKKATYAYHRTKNTDIFDNVKQAGFKPGKGAAYGVGIYFTYDIKSQMNERMINIYGPVIIRVQINLDNYLIFDKTLGKKVYGNEYSVEKHIEKVTGINFYNNRLRQDVKYTSDLAQGVLSLLKLRNIKIQNYFNGIVFTGRNDGRVVVAYNYKGIKVIDKIKSEDTNINHAEWLKDNMQVMEDKDASTKVSPFRAVKAKIKSPKN